MSHVANVEVEINDLTALKTACGLANGTVKLTGVQ